MSTSNRERAARGGWGLGAVSNFNALPSNRSLLDHATAIDGVRGGAYPLPREALATDEQIAASVAEKFGPAWTTRGATVVKREEPANPTPAAGQVWLIEDPGQPSQVYTLRGPIGTKGTAWTTDEYPGGVIESGMLTDGKYGVRARCIGVATPHGRVMVGDGFRFDDGPEATVTGVCDHDNHVRMSDGMAHSAGWVLAFGKRTRYAPARAGERYLHLSRKFLVVIPATPSILRLGNAMMGDEARVHLSAGVSMPADEWQRLDPSTASHVVATVPQVAESDADLQARCVASAAALAFTRIHGPRLANPGGIPTASPEPTAEERAATAIADRRALDLGVPRREGEPLAAFARRCNAVEVRRAVDKAITADHGPFAHARAAALHAWAETLYSHDTVADVAAVHAGLLRYEALRGSRREPSLAAMDVGVPETARAMYERERGGTRVEAVTPREEPARPTGGASLNGWQTAAHFWERWSR